MNTYDEMLGVASAPPPQPGPPQATGSYSGITQPNPLAEITTPPRDQVELEKRKAGWAALYERFQTDPVLQQAIGLIGAKMSQPLAPGQTMSGNLGAALNSGQQALSAGEFQKYERARQEKFDAAKLEESAASVANTKATTATTEAGLPRVKVESRIAEKTEKDKVLKIERETELAELNLQKAKDAKEVDRLELELRRRKAEVEKSIPDERVKAALNADIDATLLKVSAARARIAKDFADARKSTADAKKDEISIEVFQNMSPEEKKAFVTKTGTYSATKSALQQHALLWGDLFEKLPDTDSHKKGKTKEQFLLDRLQSSKQKDALELLVKAKQVGMSDEEINDLGLLDMAKASAAERKGGGAGSGGATKMVYDAKKKVYVPVTGTTVKPDAATSDTDQPVTPAKKPALAPTRTPILPEEATLNEATRAVKAARDKVLSFTLAKRKQDQQGFTKAKEELAEKIQAETTAAEALIKVKGDTDTAYFGK